MRLIVILALAISVPSVADTEDEKLQDNLFKMAASCSARYLVALDTTSDIEISEAYRFRSDWMRRFLVALPGAEAGDADDSINGFRELFLSKTYQEGTTLEDRETEIWRCDAFIRNFTEYVQDQKE